VIVATGACSLNGSAISGLFVMVLSTVAPYGTWDSPITTALLTGSALRLGGMGVDGDDVVWVEGRPWEKGRNAVLRYRPGQGAVELLPPTSSARSRVHEYGGTPVTLQDGILYWVNEADQRIWRDQAPLTPEVPGWRFVDIAVDTHRQRLYAVREEHSGGGHEPRNDIVAIDLADGAVSVLVAGFDFVSHPRLSPAGDRLAWVAWSHPDMPWDASAVWVAPFDASGGLTQARRVAGGVDSAAQQPLWAPDGTLYLLDECDGWWVPHALPPGGDCAEPLLRRPGEFGLPQWVFGISTMDLLRDGRLAVMWRQDGAVHLGCLHPASGVLDEIAHPYADIGTLFARPDGRLALSVGYTDQPGAIVLFDPATGEDEVLVKTTTLSLAADAVSVARPVRYAIEGGRFAHAYYYAPCNPAFQAPEGTRPPLMVLSHGGPTAATSGAFSLKVQFWTSRGFAVLDVNYGGSTGYGRAYRDLLKGNWGVVDVQDCAAGARWAADAGLADPARLIIAGGSAGGYTTLSALAFTNVFHAGASHYGIGDLEILARDTHKFEARYLDSLVGPWPQESALYRARSPLHHVDGLTCPVIFLQGLDDKVVPPNQAELMAQALRDKGVPVELVLFAGEGHGFRGAEAIQRAFLAELAFYGRVFGFTPAPER
jgi:dienelactone hydrolase